ncbi:MULTISPECIES: thioredoxin domain-containing protein [unclassified Microbacterium]|uniref:DsbA family protein n=1 Tax=unclassified Microbacterium TaxID=2609290 RepID=UPI001DB83828|nr:MULTISPECIES: thioredoxin domain-containing protein [unclassified Microbacterium]CAH0219981.1 Serine/threonine-protein kinase PknE [Microbacterium sp. Bi121]HWK76116.1 thioredoxin domain-containing protein [Microbacterium sp.]
MAAAAKSNTNWFAIGISAAVVVVLVALGALVVVLNNQATAPGTAPSSAIVNEETGAISFGEGETEVDTFVDFMCPICGDFEDTYGEQLQSAAADDKITLNLHPISILDRYSQNTEFSTRAASAVYCVAAEAPDSALDYFNLLFANQPEENTAGLSDDELASLADQVGAGAAADCIADGTYKRFVTSQTNDHDIQGTPTVEIDGERIENSEIGARFAQILG